MIHLRAFRAIDEYESCLAFAEGHRRVLEGFDLGNITTNNIDWATDPHVYVVVAYHRDTHEILGGIRVHITDGSVALPVENAVYHFDPAIRTMVETYSLNGGTSELCGLWNSRSLAPNLGITINLVVAGMALCSQLPVTSIFTIVASYTLKIALRMGFRIERTLGNDGEFVYPNSNYIARVLSMNPQTLDHTYEIFKSKILDLRANPCLTRLEEVSSTKTVEYSHYLELKNVTPLIYQK
jgi:hypothetical protein